MATVPISLAHAVVCGRPRASLCTVVRSCGQHSKTPITLAECARHEIARPYYPPEEIPDTEVWLKSR